MSDSWEVHHTLRSNAVGLEEKLNASGIKLHRFNNLSLSGHVIDDIMTSSIKSGGRNFAAMIDVALNDKRAIERDFGVTIIRTKIEVEPWNKLASVCLDEQYFESHFRVSGGTHSLQRIGLLISVNKKKLHTIATLRTRQTYAQHLEILDAAIHGMAQWKFPTTLIGDINTEFVAYDSNRDHDARWEERSNVA